MRTTCQCLSVLTGAVLLMAVRVLPSKDVRVPSSVGATGTYDDGATAGDLLGRPGYLHQASRRLRQADERIVELTALPRTGCRKANPAGWPESTCLLALSCALHSEVEELRQANSASWARKAVQVYALLARMDRELERTQARRPLPSSDPNGLEPARNRSTPPSFTQGGGL